ncbi:hypothetical protein C0995_010331 [Termitomyces sp. Mi166|nr:hypothetical protein C0995_010331 [Termitomyces sp. Mi166\
MYKFKRFLTINSSKPESTPESTQAVPTSSPLSDSTVDAISNYENHLSFLSRYDIILIVDDSGSMSGGCWEEAKKALQALAVEAAKYDEDGIKIHFLNSNKTLTTRNPKDISSLFKRVKPAGLTPLGTKIGKLLNEYMEEFTAAQSELKPAIYIVITDGQASDGPKTEEAVIRTARALDRYNARPDQIGIQFVQIGSDLMATEYLKMLDDTLTDKAGIRDMVDTTPSKPGVKLDLIKALLGSVNRRVDKKGSTALIGGK